MRPAESAEEWMGGVAAEKMTKGNYALILGLYRLFIKVSTVSVLAFLRYRVGVRFISFGTVFWTISFHMTVFLGLAFFSPGTASLKPLFDFSLLFIPIALWRMIEAKWNLHRRNTRPRYGADPGRSYLWLILHPFLKHLKLVPHHPRQVRWWHLDEWRFQRFMEPLLIGLLGYYFKNQGYGGFGSFLQISALCVFVHHQNLVTNYNRLKQKMMDSKLLSHAANQPIPEERPSHEPSFVFERTLRGSRDFEKWKNKQNHSKQESENYTY